MNSKTGIKLSGSSEGPACLWAENESKISEPDVFYFSQAFFLCSLRFCLLENKSEESKEAKKMYPGVHGVTSYEHYVNLMDWMSPCGYRFIKEGELEKKWARKRWWGG